MSGKRKREEAQAREPVQTQAIPSTSNDEDAHKQLILERRRQRQKIAYEKYQGKTYEWCKRIFSLKKYDPILCPIFMEKSCRTNFLMGVRHLVEVCGVNVNDPVWINDKTWEGCHIDKKAEQYPLSIAIGTTSVCSFIAKYILEQPNINVSYCDNYPIRQASYLGRYQLVRKLIALGADPFTHDSYVFRIACENGNTHLVYYLIKNGIFNVNTDDDYALRMAVLSGCTKFVKGLLAIGASVKTQDNFPLCYAIEKGFSDMVSVILDYGPNVNANNGEPLVRAVMNKDAETIRKLVARGVDIRIHYNIALKVSVEMGSSSMTKMLIDLGANPKVNFDELLRICMAKNYSKVQKILENAGVVLVNQGTPVPTPYVNKYIAEYPPIT